MQEHPRVSDVDAGAEHDVPRTAVQRWRKSTNKVLRLASLEDRDELLEGRGHCRRSETLEKFENLLAVSLSKHRQKGRQLTPRLICFILKRPRWQKLIDNFKHRGLALVVVVTVQSNCHCAERMFPSCKGWRDAVCTAFSFVLYCTGCFLQKPWHVVTVCTVHQ